MSNASGIVTRSGRALLPPDVRMPATVECPVCYEAISGSHIGLSGCAHPLCVRCILQVFGTFAHGHPLGCPLCNSNLLDAGGASMVWAVHGSKQFEFRAREFIRRLNN